MKIIENQTFDMERALYGSKDILVRNCSFDGPADGESAFKEGEDLEAAHCFFNLRYPFWHDDGLPCGIQIVWKSQIRRCMGLRRLGNAVML